MERYDRRARVLILWVAVICLSFLAFAIGVWCGEQTVPEYTVGEPQIVAEPETQPAAQIEPQEPVEAAVETVVFADPLCEDTYLMPDHPLPMDLQVMLYGACLEFEVDYRLALAVIYQETRFANLLGDDGESAGYMQVQEKWHKDRMAQLGVDDLMDPEGNFRVGCHFLKECIDKYGLEKGLGYYNSGKAQVTEYSLQVLERMS